MLPFTKSCTAALDFKDKFLPKLLPSNGLIESNFEKKRLSASAMTASRAAFTATSSPRRRSICRSASRSTLSPACIRGIIITSIIFLWRWFPQLIPIESHRLQQTSYDRIRNLGLNLLTYSLGNQNLSLPGASRPLVRPFISNRRIFWIASYTMLLCPNPLSPVTRCTHVRHCTICLSLIPVPRSPVVFSTDARSPWKAKKW